MSERDFLLGDWLVQPTRNRVVRGGREVSLRPKVMDVLEAFARRPGEVVPKQTLIDEVWARTFIADTALTRAVFELRAALDDKAGASSVIETVAKRGYRLTLPVRPLGEGEAAACRLDCPYLLVVEDKVIPLRLGENLIGRDRSAAVRIDAGSVSRRHARIVAALDGAVIEDLGSKNGTFVAGRRIEGQVVLQDGAEIAIGPTVAIFRPADALCSTETAQ